MKGIILVGGSGTRLYPITYVINKHLIPIYDKPMIYYPLSVLMLAGIREILIISTSRDLNRFKELLGDGSEYGIKLEYKIQDRPNGLGEAFILGESFIGDSGSVLILGDNIFYGHGLTGILEKAKEQKVGATIFGYYITDPKDFGVVEFNEKGKVLSLEEKPENPKSNYVVPGLYFYDNTVIDKAKKIKPSKRGELEITDINRLYMEEGNLNLINLGRGMAWLDTGTHDGLLEASNFVRTIQNRQGIMIACLEEIAYKKGWIDSKKLEERVKLFSKTKYGEYLKRLCIEKI